MINWPEHLIKDIARRRCVIFLGAGVSRNSTNQQGRRPKTWEEFLRDSAAQVQPNRHVLRLINQADYLTACEVIRIALGPQPFAQLLRDEFMTPRYQHAPIHEHIFRLDSRIVATPNFDKIYETYANHQAGASIIVKHHYDPDVSDALRDDGRLILKIHGSIDSPLRMVFTRSEYAEARNKFRSFYEILDALAITHTFVFIGSGVNDPDLKLLLEDVFFRHPASRTHFMVLPRGAVHDSVKTIVEKTMNLKILLYSKVNNHAELTDSLDALSTDVETKRDDLRQTGNW